MCVSDVCEKSRLVKEPEMGREIAQSRAVTQTLVSLFKKQKHSDSRICSVDCLMSLESRVTLYITRGCIQRDLGMFALKSTTPLKYITSIFRLICLMTL